MSVKSKAQISHYSYTFIKTKIYLQSAIDFLERTGKTFKLKITKVFRELKSLVFHINIRFPLFDMSNIPIKNYSTNKNILLTNEDLPNKYIISIISTCIIELN